MPKGFSLLELVVGIVVTGGVGLVIAQFSSNAMQAQKNSNLIAQTEQKMRMFLEVQKKHISASLPVTPPVTPPPDPNNCRILGVEDVPSLPNCGDETLKFAKLKLQRFRDPLNSRNLNSQDPNLLDPFFETTTTQCVDPPPRVPIDAAALATALADLQNWGGCSPPSPCPCSPPCTNGQVPVVRTTANGTVLSLSGGQQTDASPVLASALCITHNAPLIANNPASFNLVNLRLRTLVLQNNVTRLLEMSASVPTPRLQPGNIRVLSSGK
ncbi:MAG: hypothetical protein NT000_00610 [Proteobacteria bacterium]|nr:hypothetical protein [Pseudomonadota bacterium]